MNLYFDIDGAEFKTLYELFMQLYNNSIDVFEWTGETNRQINNLIQSKQSEISKQIIISIAKKVAQDEINKTRV